MSGVSVINVKVIGEGKVQVVILQNDIVYYVYNGFYMFEGQFVKNICGVVVFYFEMVQFVVRVDSDIKSF